jgi:hypothetical protein
MWRCHSRRRAALPSPLPAPAERIRDPLRRPRRRLGDGAPQSEPHPPAAAPSPRCPGPRARRGARGRRCRAGSPAVRAAVPIMPCPTGVTGPGRLSRPARRQPRTRKTASPPLRPRNERRPPRTATRAESADHRSQTQNPSTAPSARRPFSLSKRGMVDSCLPAPTTTPPAPHPSQPAIPRTAAHWGLDG